jgi:hypothetical protein
MSEENRIKIINERAAGNLHDWLLQLENEEVTPDDLLAELYGGMIAAILLGYSPESMVEDAKKGAEKIMALAEEQENEQS